MAPYVVRLLSAVALEHANPRRFRPLLFVREQIDFPFSCLVCEAFPLLAMAHPLSQGVSANMRREKPS